MSASASSSAESPFRVANVRLFVAFRVLFNARFYYPVFTILFLDFGLTLEQFALLNALWAGTIVLAEVPSGALADILGRRNLVVVAATLMVIELALIAFLPMDGSWLVVGAFALNRILSGLAEAAASGADEALAYDSLNAAGLADKWPRVLERLAMLQSGAFFIAALLGAAMFDNALVTRVVETLGLPAFFATESWTTRAPIVFTLVTSLICLAITLRMREVRGPEGRTEKSTRGQSNRLRETFQQVFATGAWLMRTPFPLFVILAGLVFDSLTRLFITLVSEYYRLIDLPEASYGILMSVMALLGIPLAPIARRLAERHTPLFNAFFMAVILIVGLVGVTFVIPWWGVIPALLVFSLFPFLNFFLSHYLNRAVDSSRRATTLSFRGLAMNLGYGALGIFYGIAVAGLREVPSLVEAADPQRSVFVEALKGFPAVFLVMFGLLLLAGSRLRIVREAANRVD